MNKRPILSKTEYVADENIYLLFEEMVVQELVKDTLLNIQIVRPDKQIQQIQIDDCLTEDQAIIFPHTLFNQPGRHQLKIYSESYGQLLFLFSIKKERAPH